MDISLKNQIVTLVEPVFIYPLVNQLPGFGQVSVPTMLHHLFASFRAVEKINLEENAVIMMEPYDPAEPLARRIKQLEKGR